MFRKSEKEGNADCAENREKIRFFLATDSLIKTKNYTKKKRKNFTEEEKEKEGRFTELENAEMGGTIIEKGLATIKVGRTTFEVGGTNAEVGRATIEVGGANAEVGWATIEDGGTTIEIGRTTIEVGRTVAEVGGTYSKAWFGVVIIEIVECGLVLKF